MSKYYSKLFPEDIAEYIHSNYAGNGPKAMAAMLNDKFGTSYTRNQLKRYYHNHNINSGTTGWFEKGCIPMNKGKKMSREQYEASKATMFKNGMRPHNTKKVGDMSKRSDGRWYYKVSDGNWELLNRYVYEQYYGPIPEGCLVVHKDGDMDNMHPDNLILIDRGDNIVMNSQGLRFANEDLFEAGLTLARIKMKCKQLEERNERIRKK